MTRDRQPFTLLGRTRWEKARNIVGLALVLGFVISKYVDFSIDRVSTVDIVASGPAMTSTQALRASLSSFQPNDGNLTIVATAIKSTIEEVKQNVAISFIVRDTPALSVTVECSSRWPKEKLDRVCAAFGSDLKEHLGSAR